MPFDLARDVRWGLEGRSGGEWPYGGEGRCGLCGAWVALTWWNGLASLSPH